jgi:hypothetical protein
VRAAAADTTTPAASDRQRHQRSFDRSGSTYGAHAPFALSEAPSRLAAARQGPVHPLRPGDYGTHRRPLAGFADLTTPQTSMGQSGRFGDFLISLAQCAPPRSSPGGLGALQVPALLEQHPEIVRRVGDAAFDAASVGGLGALQIPALVLQQQFPLRCQRDSRGLSVDRPSRLSVLGSGLLSTGGRTSASALCDFAGHACYWVGALATRDLALGEHLDERFDDARVELRSGAAA